MRLNFTQPVMLHKSYTIFYVKCVALYCIWLFASTPQCRWCLSCTLHVWLFTAFG